MGLKKRICAGALAFAMAMICSACGEAEPGGAPGQAGTPGATDQAGAMEESQTAVSQEVHSHEPFQGENVVEHEPGGYCGNTVTTVSYCSGDEKWEKSFWGSESVSLTDLLLYLDYSGDICRCMPEYTVDTEFGEDYGISLSGGYVRHEGGQTQLTEEQTEEVRRILEWAALLEEDSGIVF